MPDLLPADGLPALSSEVGDSATAWSLLMAHVHGVPAAGHVIAAESTPAQHALHLSALVCDLLACLEVLWIERNGEDSAGALYEWVGAFIAKTAEGGR